VNKSCQGGEGNEEGGSPGWGKIAAKPKNNSAGGEKRRKNEL